MTVVACWRDEEGFTWLAADTRISNVGQGGGLIVKTDSGAKLSAIEVSCIADRSVETNGRSYGTHLGFGFAGSVLPAVMTALTASSLLSNLAPMRMGLGPPEFLELAEPIRVIAERFSREHYSALPSERSLFKAFITGFCAHKMRPRAALIEPKLPVAGQIQVVISEIDLDKGAFAIGSGAEEFTSRLAKKEQASPKGGLGRHPMFVVQEMAEQGHGDVGGNLSMGTVGFHGFRPVAKLQPTGGPTFHFNGIDVFEDLPLVGGYALFPGAM